MNNDAATAARYAVRAALLKRGGPDATRVRELERQMDAVDKVVPYDSLKMRDLEKARHKLLRGNVALLNTTWDRLIEREQKELDDFTEKFPEGFVDPSLLPAEEQRRREAAYAVALKQKRGGGG